MSEAKCHKVSEWPGHKPEEKTKLCNNITVCLYKLKVRSKLNTKRKFEET